MVKVEREKQEPLTSSSWPWCPMEQGQFREHQHLPRSLCVQCGARQKEHLPLSMSKHRQSTDAAQVTKYQTLWINESDVFVSHGSGNTKLYLLPDGTHPEKELLLPGKPFLLLLSTVNTVCHQGQSRSYDFLGTSHCKGPLPLGCASSCPLQ